MVTRLRDPGAIEQRLLELAHTTDAKITGPALAYFAPCSLEDATRVLDDLAARGRLGMDVEDDGTITYSLPGRQKLAPRTTALVREVRAPRRQASPTVAAMLALVVPGAGHLYTGHVLSAILWFLVVGMGWALFLPGLILHLFNIASAAASAHRANVEASRLLPAG